MITAGRRRDETRRDEGGNEGNGGQAGAVLSRGEGVYQVVLLSVPEIGAADAETLQVEPGHELYCEIWKHQSRMRGCIRPTAGTRGSWWCGQWPRLAAALQWCPFTTDPPHRSLGWAGWLTTTHTSLTLVRIRASEGEE